MGYTTLTGGLELVIPDNGQKNWGTIVKNSTWQAINDHRHTGSGDGNQLLGSSFADHTVTKLQLSKNIAVTQQATLTPAGTTETIDWDDGNKAILDLSSASGDVLMTLDNPIEGASYRVKIIQGATERVVGWPAAVLFPGGEELTQYQLASTTMVIWLDYDGTNYLAHGAFDYA